MTLIELMEAAEAENLPAPEFERRFKQLVRENPAEVQYGMFVMLFSIQRTVTLAFGHGPEKGRVN